MATNADCSIGRLPLPTSGKRVEKSRSFKIIFKQNFILIIVSFMVSAEASDLKRRTIDFLAQSQALCPSQLVPRFPTLFACQQHLKIISVPSSTESNAGVIFDDNSAGIPDFALWCASATAAKDLKSHIKTSELIRFT